MQLRRGLLLVVLAALLALVAAGPGLAGGAGFTVTDLGVLEGFTHSRAAAINASGQIVGDCFNGGSGDYSNTTNSQAFIWQGGVMTGLPALAGFANSCAVDINASGQVVGTCWHDYYCCDCTSVACLWTYNADTSTWEVTALLDAQAHLGSSALLINNAGQVLLRSTGVPDATAPPSYNGRFCGGTLWDNGTLTDIISNGSPVWVEGLNENGQVVGQPCCDDLSIRLPIRWAGGAATDLVSAANGYGDAFAINTQGEVVGFFSDASQYYDFLWLPADAYGLTAGLNTSPRESSFCCSVTSSINDAGLTLQTQASYLNGRYRTLVTLRDLTTGQPIASATVPRSTTFDWSYPGRMNASGEMAGGCDSPDSTGLYAGYYLSAAAGHSYLPSLSGSVLDGYTWATDINDAGQIVGFSSPSAGEIHAALWTGTAPVNQAPVLEAITTPLSAVSGIPVTFTATGTDADLGDSDFLTYRLADQPTNAGINPTTGSFSWTPSATGSATFEVVVSDGERTDSQSVTIDVAANQAPVLNAITTPVSIVLGDTVSFTATASDAEAEALTFGLTGAPTGAAIDPATGAFSWTPTAAGTYSFSVQVADANGSDSQLVTVNVSALSVSTATLSRNRKGVVLVNFTVRNPNSTAAETVKITAASLDGGTLLTGLPVALRTVRAGASKSAKLQFSGATAGAATLTVSGTSSLGNFSSTLDVTIP